MLIGLSGYAQSGKDSVAEVLVRDFGFTRIAFADKIKELLYEIDDNVRFIVDTMGWDKAKQNPVIRRKLQDLGMNARKVFDDDFWIRQAIKGIGLQTRVVITDVRFPNEMQAVWEMDGRVWRVDRPGVDAVNDHISEHAIKELTPDVYINNTGTLEDLEIAVHNIMRHAG